MHLINLIFFKSFPIIKVYEFKFTVPVVPDEFITITPTVANGSNYDSVFVYPESFTFSNTTDPSLLEGSFILEGQAGNYNLTLVVTGADAPQYNDTVVPLTVLDNDAPPLPPSLDTAVFSLSGAQLDAYFDSPTDQGVTISSMQEDSWPCNELFSFQGDSTALCSWISNTNVQVSFY